MIVHLTNQIRPDTFPSVSIVYLSSYFAAKLLETNEPSPNRPWFQARLQSVETRSQHNPLKLFFFPSPQSTASSRHLFRIQRLTKHLDWQEPENADLLCPVRFIYRRCSEGPHFRRSLVRTLSNFCPLTRSYNFRKSRCVPCF